ncbi:MAG: hypothetical protein AAGB26_00325 [Planctomycetota bacterium]
MTTNTTAVNSPANRYQPPRRRSNWGVLTLLAIALHIGGLGTLWQLGFFETALAIDKEEAKQMAEEAERRARERRERERKEREERSLREEDRDKLEDYEREQARQQLLAYVEELQRIDEEMLDLKDTSLDGLELREEDQYRLFLAQQVLRLSRGLQSDLTNFQDPDYRRFAQTTARRQLYAPLQTLVQVAERVVEDVNNTDRVNSLVQQADVNKDNTQRLFDQAPPSRREAETEANATGDEIQRLAYELAGKHALDPSEYRNTQEARRNQDPGLRPDNLPQLSPEDLLDLARQLEENINQNFDDLRAGQLAQQLNLPLSQVMEGLTPSGLPPREQPQFPGQTPETFADLQALQEALQQAADLAGQMAGRAGQQLSSAQGMVPGPPGLLPGMGLGLLPGMGGGMGSSPFGIGMSQPGGTPGRLDMRQNLDLTPPDPNAQGSGANEVDNEGNTTKGGENMITGTRLPDVDLANREDFIHANSLPGHRFSATSDRSGWVYLNTFYTIGPWENNGRIDWDNTHAPDPQPFMNIDLDAVYTDGKTKASPADRNTRTHPNRKHNAVIDLDGKLRWRFVQTDTIRMTFPEEYEDGTYYAYTEVYFEQDMDMDVLIASDDATTAWISNSHPAYNAAGNAFRFHTEDTKSSWELGESRKRLRFTKGLNRILVRLENGPHYARLSVLLSPVGAIDEQAP